MSDFGPYRYNGKATSIELTEEKLADGIHYVLTYWREHLTDPVYSERYRDGLGMALDRFQVARAAIMVCEGSRDR